MSTPDDERNPVEALAEEFMERKRRGEQPTLREYVERYPELADEIRELFPALAVMEDLGVSSSLTDPLAGSGASAVGTGLTKLGDYRILREIGHGGMGVVYEAEQESLGRRVALKVLSANAVIDAKQVRRFEREARAAARLHHTNIVPVFGVGHQDGHYYYVMQFIQGQTLDAVLGELRRLKASRARATAPGATAPDPSPGPNRSTPLGRPTVPDGLAVTAAEVADSLFSGRFSGLGSDRTAGVATQAQTLGSAGVATIPASSDLPGGPPPNPTPPAADPPVPSLSHSAELAALSESDRHFYRAVARVGLQVASALDYANRQGILHRDIKPSNLLLDSRGNVWVTDFGLAKAEDADDLTHTGDILGTIRYMAPERFQGRCDVRSDLYSLGLTLYELVALRPAYEASERHRLMERVLHEEPTRLRKLAPTVPRDLEILIQKAMARDPEQRYATPAAFAEDLERFLADKPIRARQISATERFVRWCRRNPMVAGLSLGMAVLLLGVAVAATLAAARFRTLAEHEREARAATELALQREEGLRRTANRAKEAAEAAERKEAEARLRAEANQREAMRLQQLAEGNFRLARQAVDDYLTRVSEHRLLRVPGLQPLRRELLESALGYYQRFLTRRTDDPALQKDLALAYTRMAKITAEIGSRPEAARILDKAREIRQALQARDPKDPGLQLDLVDHYVVAAALQRQLGELEQAKRSCQEAHRLLELVSPQDPEKEARITTAGGTSLTVKVHTSEKAEILDRFFRVLNEAGAVAAEAGDATEAVSWYAQALYVQQALVRDHRRDPRIAQFQAELADQWSRLGRVEGRLGLTEEALACHQEARMILEELLHSHPRDAESADFLHELAATYEDTGESLAASRRLGEALRSYQQALGLRRRLARENPAVLDYHGDLARTYFTLGTLQAQADDLAGALPSLQQAVERQRLLVEMAPGVKAYARVLSQQSRELARVQRQANQPAEARASYRQAETLLEKLPPESPEDFHDLAVARAACSSLAGWGQAGPTADEAERARKQRDADGALAALRQAVAAGYADLDRIQADREFDPLRARADFQALLRDLAKKRTVLVWNQDLEAARVQAAREQKDLFLYFGGSDWCPFDHAMRQTYLSKEPFRAYAVQHFVVVEFDDPIRKAKPKNHPTRLQLAERWSINACPTTILADATGRRYAELIGAFPGESMDGYLKRLEELRKVRIARDENLARAKASRGPERARWLAQALGGIQPTALAEYPEELQEILRLAPEEFLRLISKSPELGIQHGRFLAQGDADDRLAADLVRGVLERHPDQPQALLLAGSFYSRRARRLREASGGPPSAEVEQAETRARALYEKLIALRPEEPAYAAELADLLRAAHREQPWQVLEPLQMTSAGGATLTRRPDGSILAGGANPETDVYTITARAPARGITAVRLEALPDPSLPHRGPGRCPANGNFVLTEFAVAVGGRPLEWSGALASHYEREPRSYPIGAALDGRPETGWAIMPQAGRPQQAVFALAAPLDRPGEIPLTIRLAFSFGKGHTLGRLRLAVTTQPEPLRADHLAYAATFPGVDGWTRLGAARALRAEWPEALAALEKATARPPGDGGYGPFLRALAHHHLGQTAEAGQWLDRALTWFQDNETGERFHRMAGMVMSQVRGIGEAAANRRIEELAGAGHRAVVSRAVAAKPNDASLRYLLAMDHLLSGDLVGYRAVCAAMLEQFGTTADPRAANRVAYACIYAPDAVADLPTLIRVAERSVPALPGGERIVGAVLYRAGRYEEALTRFEESHRVFKPRAWDWLFLAMAHARLGHAAEARSLLEKADRWIAAADQTTQGGASGEEAPRWLSSAEPEQIRLLRREAEATILLDSIFPADPFAP